MVGNLIWLLQKQLSKEANASAEWLLQKLKIRGCHKTSRLNLHCQQNALGVTADLPCFPARCFSDTIPAYACGVGDPTPLHGADCGSVHEEGACPCPGYCLPTVKRYSMSRMKYSSHWKVSKLREKKIPDYKKIKNKKFWSFLRSGNGISGYLLHYVHLLQCRHHLGPLLFIQLLPVTATLAELQQHLEHRKLYQLPHRQQYILHSQSGVLQVCFIVWEKLWAIRPG